MTALRRFEAYQPAAVRWIERLPAHWHVRRIKTFLREVDVRSGTGEGTLLTMRRASGLVPLSDLSNKVIEPQRLRHYKLASPSQIVMNPMQAGNGMFAVCNTPGLISPDYRAFELTGGGDPRYFIALFKSEAMRATFRAESKGLGTGTAGFLRLYPERFGSLFSPFPPLDEQHRIADFLDTYNVQVQRLVAAKRQVKRLLNERRQAIIRELVFRGIRQSAQFTNSGIQWFGEAPIEWDKIHIGAVADTIPGPPFDSRLFGAEQGVPVIRIRDLLKGHTNLTVGGDVPSSSWIHNGDLLVGMDGDFNSVIWHGGNAVLNQRLCCIRPHKRISADFLALILPFALGFINHLTFSTTVKHLSMFDIRRLRFPAPCPAEQVEIVSAAVDRTRSLDFALSRVDTEIALISEYRDTVIASIVTGRIDVRDAEVAAVEGPELSDLPSDDEEMEDMLEEAD